MVYFNRKVVFLFVLFLFFKKRSDKEYYSKLGQRKGKICMYEYLIIDTLLKMYKLEL